MDDPNWDPPPPAMCSNCTGSGEEQTGTDEWGIAIRRTCAIGSGRGEK